MNVFLFVTSAYVMIADSQDFILMNPFVFRDKQGCSYLYSIKKRQLVCINDLMYLILENYFQIGDLVIKDEWLKEYDTDFLKRNIDRFLFFKSHQFLDPLEIEVNAIVDINEVNNHLANVNQICFELTQKCNLACTYCCYGDLYNHEGNNNESELDEETVLCFIDILRDSLLSSENISSYRKITIGFYGGEALLKMDMIKKVVGYINDNIKNIPNISIDYIMTTNGLLLNRYIDFLVENDFSIMVSLDGNYSNSSYRKTKSGENVFDVLMSNLYFVRDKYSSYFNSNIVFNSVIHDRNSVEDVVSFIYSEFHKLPQLSELSESLIRNDKVEIFRQMRNDVIVNYRSLKNIISEKDYLLLNSSLKYVPIFFYRLLNLNMKNWSDFFVDYTETARPSMCLPFSNKIFISATGELHLCEHIGYKYPLGYIDKRNRKLIFDAVNVSQRYTKYLSLMSEECSKCADLLTCDICIFQKQMKCKHMTSTDFSSKISHNMEILREREQMSLSLF